jgi:predicted transposase YdaD
VSKTIAKAHDRFFKELFSRPTLIRSFVEGYLDPAVSSALDPDSLEIDNSTFVNPELDEYLSDLVCKARLTDGRPCLIYLLFDHKSHPDALAPLQLARYVMRMWEMHVKAVKESAAEARRAEGAEPGPKAPAEPGPKAPAEPGPKAPAEPGPKAPAEPALPLPLIVPVVVYHGLTPWRVPTDLSDLINAPPGLGHFRPHLCYNLVDLSCYEDAQINGAALLCAGLLILKHIWSQDLAERLPEIFDLWQDITESPDALWALEAVIRYLASAAPHLEKSELTEILRRKLPELGGKTMPTIAEQWIEEGEKKGEKKAKLETARRLLERGLSPDEVATLVDLPKEQVQALTH